MPVERNDALLLAGIALLLVGLGVQGGRRAVPHVDARRVPGRADAGHRRSWRRSAKAAGVRRAAPRVRRRPSGATATTGGRSIWVLAVLSLRRRLGPRRRADRRQADARLLVDHPRRLHPRRRRGRRPPRRRGRQRARRAERRSSTCSPTRSWSPAPSASSPSSAATATATPTSTPSAASARSGRCWRSPSPCSCSPRPACRSRRGFIAKFGVIRAAVDEHSYALAIIAMLSSVIAAFLYLRIMVSAWMSDPPAEGERGASRCDPVLGRPGDLRRRRSSRCSSASPRAGSLDAAEHDHAVRPLTVARIRAAVRVRPRSARVAPSRDGPA